MEKRKQAKKIDQLHSFEVLSLDQKRKVIGGDTGKTDDTTVQSAYCTGSDTVITSTPGGGNN